MRKYKGVILSIQMFCVLLLIISKYLEPGVTQIAYCFTAFSSPVLLLAYGEDTFFSENTCWQAMAVFVAEFLISFLFVGAMITGMRMNGGTIDGFGVLLIAYAAAFILAIADRISLGCLRRKMQN